MTPIESSKKECVKGDESKQRSGYMTTTELARLCGVSRFTIINWTKQGRIKATRTIGRHYRIPVSEALSLLRTFGKGGKTSSSDLQEPCHQQVPTTTGDEECGNCLTGKEKETSSPDLKEPCHQQVSTTTGDEECGNCLTNNENKQVKAKKKNVLYAFGYGVGCGIHVLKGRKIK